MTPRQRRQAQLVKMMDGQRADLYRLYIHHIGQAPASSMSLRQVVLAILEREHPQRAYGATG